MGNDATSATRGEDVSHLSVHPGVIPLLCLAGHSRAERNFTPWYLECNGSWMVVGNTDLRVSITKIFTKFRD